MTSPAGDTPPTPFHGFSIPRSDMIESGNRTCGSGRDDIWGTARPRDIRLQIYISLALGSAAFLAFCVRRPVRPVSGHGC